MTRATQRVEFISAGAGSGKTTALAELLQAELVAGRVQPEGLLATTFTQRAAAELRERVHGQLVSGGDHALATAIAGASIGTVNSVCGRLLQRFAFEAGLSPNQRVLDEARATQLLREALDGVVEGPALTELMQVARRLSLLEPARQGEPVPWRKALRSLVDQARSNQIDATALRGQGPINASRLLTHFPAPQAGDADLALAQAIEHALPGLRAASAASGKTNTADYVELVERASKDLAAGSLSWGGWNKLAGAAPEKGLQTLASPIADAAARFARHAGLHQDLSRYLTLMFELAADTLDAYAQAKRELGVLDFTDQERLLLDLLDDPGVAATLADELDLLLVDEFQDTSPIQLALFLKLAALARQTVWVGDVKQAIYGFRGSDTRLMNAVVEALPSIGGSKRVLDSSWRSRPALVDFVNELFGDAFKGIARQDVVLRAQRPETKGSVALADWTLSGSNQAEIHQALATGVARLMAERAQVIDREDGQARDIRWSDIAVLARSNEAVVDIARALRQRGIPSATRQPGLLGQAEVVLALACLRRLNDAGDTLATAEVVSLVDCQAPELWLADRLAWLASGGDEAAWLELAAAGRAAHPIIATLLDLREQAALLTPREAVALVIERCGLARCAVQWQRDADLARVRLANLDRLLELAAQYEDECLASRRAATLSGLLLWMQDLAAEGQDTLGQPAVDAVQVLTHHGAKGLEWHVVVLCDLAGDVRDRLWDIQAESLQGFDVSRPLHQRFLRYWPWAFGKQKKVAVAAQLALSPVGVAARADAVEEHKRLLYVSMTRARDTLVLARKAKNPVGEWMETVSLGARLPAGDAAWLHLPGSQPIAFARWALTGVPGSAPAASEPGLETKAEMASPSGTDLVWWSNPASPAPRLALRLSPSSAAGAGATIAETVALGNRLVITGSTDPAQVGQAVHACIAATLAAPQQMAVAEIEAILQRMGAQASLDPAALQRQICTIRDWLRQRWPDAVALVELPMNRWTDQGQLVNGRADLVLKTPAGWILLDHKSTPQGSAQWPEVAHQHAGQMLAYGALLEAASGLPVLETWLVLPVAAAALRLVFCRSNSVCL